MTLFSFRRWRLLVGRHWAENKKRYALSFLAFVALLVLWYVFAMLADQDYALPEGLQRGTFFLSLFAIGTFYASQFFSDLSSKSKGTNLLLTPASTLEHLLCALFYVVVLFFGFFLLAFYVADAAMVALANALHASMKPETAAAQRSEVINVFVDHFTNSSVNLSYYFLLGFFAVQAFFLLGSVYFTKYSFIKTGIAVFLVFITLFLLEAYVLHSGLPKTGHDQDFISLVTYSENLQRQQVVRLSPWIGGVLTALFRYAFAPLFWMVTYYRLKEKEL